MMDSRINFLVITLAIASIGLSSLIINQNANADSHYCADEKGKSEAWIDGCKQGWYDHDHCFAYNPGTGEVAKGYKIGWSKGSC